jgi:hypothetical protein
MLGNFTIETAVSHWPYGGTRGLGAVPHRDPRGGDEDSWGKRCTSTLHRLYYVVL